MPDASQEACPVSPETRAAWLKAGANTATFPDASVKAAQASKDNSCDSSEIDQPTTPSRGFFSRWFKSSPVPSTTLDSKVHDSSLGVDRVISTIPRTTTTDTGPGSRPANNEAEGGTSEGGNWIYPSEKMFFEAMKRKGHGPKAQDMRTVVPMHNAVNEKTWKEILEWERPYGAKERCGGPRLHSFAGLSTTLSPRARFKTLMGYTAPFDRHDWTVDRCGTRIDYIIDYYQGRSTGDGKINFYLDVRPKLNTWEGCRMRAIKALGLA